MMRILVLNFEYPPLGGGASPIGKELSERYVSQGHAVEVVTMHYGSLPFHEKVNGVSIHRVKSQRSRINISKPLEQLIYLWRSKKVVKKLLEEKHFDVCHCHFLIPTGILALWVKSRHDLPFIVTIHGSDVPGYNPDRFLFLHQFTGPLLRKIIKGASAIVSPSEYLMSLLTENVWRSQLTTPRKIIEYGIAKIENTTVSKKNILLSTGRLLPRKGFKELILAVSSEDVGYEVHICGDGPEMPMLEKLAKESATKIILHGWLNSESAEYKNLLATAKIFALVSSHENSSVSLMEAMSNRCAVITSDGTGCYEMIQDVGLCVPAQNIEALTNAIESLVSNEDKINEFGNLAFHKSIKKYDWNVITNKYLLLMSEVSIQTRRKISNE